MKVLISAYACEPERGSEPGCGWNWSCAAARRHDVWVLTRANNRPRIEVALEAMPQRRLHFVYLDLPIWARFWKRGGLGVRVYYLLWQIAAARAARRLHKAHEFDVVHHLTFANMWLPALVCMTRAPFVLGPIAGGQRVPLPLYGALGVRGMMAELLLLALRGLNRANPLVRIGWARAVLILANNDETLRALPRKHRKKTVLRPNATVERAIPSRPPPADGGPLALYAGRLNRFKGISIVIEALRLIPTWRLVVAGDGPDRRRLERLARRNGLNGRVTFAGWLTQERLWEQVASARALVLPSLKEGASFVAAEAQALGVPVVAFDRGGPAALARMSGSRFELVPPGPPSVSARSFAAALERLEEHPHPVSTVDADFGLDAVASDLAQVYAQAADGWARSASVRA
jgi:glycosyltransferase involved in cell wall biosynthesis